MIKIGDIIVVTGIMAAGKSTVAQALAERLPASVHLRGDIFRRFIVNGQEAVTLENWPNAERQLHLRYRLAADAALTYADAGFTVVYQDVILGTEVSHVLDLLTGSAGLVYLVVLAPSPAFAAERDRSRNKTGYSEWKAEVLDGALRADTPRIGLWLDTSELSVEATVDAIIANLDRAVVATTP